MNKVQLKKDLRLFLLFGTVYFMVVTIINSLLGEINWTLNILQAFAVALIWAVINHFTHNFYEQ